MAHRHLVIDADIICSAGLIQVGDTRSAVAARFLIAEGNNSRRRRGLLFRLDNFSILTALTGQREASASSFATQNLL